MFPSLHISVWPLKTARPSGVLVYLNMCCLSSLYTLCVLFGMSGWSNLSSGRSLLSALCGQSGDCGLSDLSLVLVRVVCRTCKLASQHVP